MAKVGRTLKKCRQCECHSATFQRTSQGSKLLGPYIGGKKNDCMLDKSSALGSSEVLVDCFGEDSAHFGILLRIFPSTLET